MTETSRSQQRWNASTMTRGEFASRRRLELIKVLSPDAICAKCGATFTHDVLEVDHVDGCTWDKRKSNAWCRVARYWREHASGIKLQALCRGCNASDGTRRFRGRRRY